MERSAHRHGDGWEDTADLGHGALGPPGRPSFIGSTMVLKGDLSLAEDLIIEGTFDGSITQGNHRLSIGKHARVKATIRTGSAIIAGIVEGNVHGSSTVIVKKTARLHGALTAERLCLESGANLEDVILSGNIARTKVSD
ncbi:MAG: polymer-forming cytoskeletal protein [Woeseia sp.]